jgi:predicted nuclease of predicted toxin-antitoxin system
LISFYFDEMMPRPVMIGLAEAGVDVVMAVDVEMTEQDDFDHLRNATEHGRVMVTLDRPFSGKAMGHGEHGGVICWTGPGNEFGVMIRALLAFARSHEADEVQGRVFWLKE